MHQHLIDPCYFRFCHCPRLYPFQRRQYRIILARKSQSRHHLEFEIHSLLQRMPCRFLHILHRILEIHSRTNSDILEKVSNLLPVVLIEI
ncbi:UNVERIFIED_CONTAM: hypothetical protein NCL1_20722 [Trichonephila clavipes]